MTLTRPQPNEDRIGYALRLTLYATCAVLPFGALALGQLTGEEAVAAVVTLFAALGPVVALSRATTEKQVEREAYAVGLEHGFEADEPPHGRHRLDEGQ
ncbi:MAG TPA: hypothetical protein VK039_01995 [Brevibacterium sp.]|nr:hypothetical protein [Brevibacterium sp.]